MKGIVIAISVILGIILGIFPSIYKPKPRWWKLLVSSFFIINLVLVISPVLVADLNYVNFLAQSNSTEVLTINPNDGNLVRHTNLDTFFIEPITYPIITKIPFESLKDKLLKIQFDPTTKHFNVLATTNKSFIPLTYPYIIELKERIKIMVLHVPVAWTAVLAYLFAMIFAVRYLQTKDLKFDIYAVSSAGVGVIMTILATITGMIWAKFNWGSYWNWDPRETSIFVLLLIYFAYFALRQSIENPETRSRLSAVYSIIAFATVPFFVFILPRISSGLHPGASGEGTSGPVLGGGTGMLDNNLLFTFGFSMFCFSLLFFWILNLKIRSEILYNSK
jgi:heme exporter protein C